MERTESLTAAAKGLIRRLYACYDSYYGLSTTSCQVYDTAWVAMVVKTTGNTRKWLFPESFYYLLKTQSDDGSWGAHAVTKTAGILDTAAALFALIKHLKEPLQIYDVSSNDIYKRIESASQSLRNQLATWDDFLETNHIGAEMIIPSLLAYLEKEDERLTFSFPCKDVPDSMNKAKLSHFTPESLYGKKPTSMIHSLEAFLGKIDFDRVSHHLFRGSMMASPSSTAAYLMGVSVWDEEAERYLQHIIKAGAGHGDGGIPGTFPTTYFEYSWTISTLLHSGFTKSDLECPELQGTANILIQAFQDEHGIIGFAPRAADVDDTAKGLLALNLLDQHLSPDQMIKVFERQDHFTTFDSERDPSLTSNCHVLLALLHEPDFSHYYPQILKTTKFICEFWWNSDYHTKDKWHLSHLYPAMLLTEAFTKLLRLLDSRTLSDIVGEELHRKVSISLFQACFRTLLEQREDGSWNGMPEQTCYAILSLAESQHVCFFNELKPRLQSAIHRGVDFLKSRSFQFKDQNWTSKTAYKVSFVAEAYELAVLKVFESLKAPAIVGSTSDTRSSVAELDGFGQLVSKTPLFAKIPEWQIRASLLESSLFVPLLKAQRLKVYARDEIPVTEDKYLNIIPFTWVGCNNRRGTFASTSFLYEMMLLSLLGYQTDEFFEAVVAPAFPETASLHKLIDNIIDYVDKDAVDNTHDANGLYNINITNDDNNHGNLLGPQEINSRLTHFVTYILNHKAVLRSSTWDRENLCHDLRAFLHAQAAQTGENSRFAKQEPQSSDVYASATSSFFQWVRTTGGDHVACAYTLAFACCLISSSLSSGREVFPTVTQKYLAAAATRHLTTICRMYNDLGSLARDTMEHNINSLHFPEFAHTKTSTTSVVAKKQALTELAEYESGCLSQTLKLLDGEIYGTRNGLGGHGLGSRKMSIFRFYCDVTDFYGQLYALRDLSSSLK